jgi:hypothetical protein
MPSIWFLFSFTLLGRVPEQPLYAVLLAVLVGALGVRLWARATRSARPLDGSAAAS